MKYPFTRLRRSRQAAWSRGLTHEHVLTVNDLIYPMFVTTGEGVRTPIEHMPGCYRLSMDEAVKEALLAQSLGIGAIALFPCVAPELKDELGSEALNPNNLMCQTLGMMKDAGVTLGLIADVALDPYTTHGHDGVLSGLKVDNDRTVAALVKQALVLSEAGADVVAPSDMQDGRVKAIRRALEAAGHQDTLILAYSAKYASALYSPFRGAIGSQQKTPIDKSTYQMQPANAKEALLEVSLDIAEGADWVMVKPGSWYLDIVQQIAATQQVPVMAYQVSGEYAMLTHLAAIAGEPLEPLLHESLIAFKRAGATAILTYGALHMARYLNGS